MSLMLPDTTFYMHEYPEGETGGCSITGAPEFKWSIKKSSDLFAGKRVVIFALPGAFTPTCSSMQLPGYELNFNKFQDLGIDEIYCTAVNDAFVMRSWEVDQGLQHVKMLPDGNANFARSMGMLVDKSNLGFGQRSWRYALIATDLKVDKMWIEDGVPTDLYPADPFRVSGAENLLAWLSKSDG
jgi:thioredoxin-dependent peroxiredoxin